MNDIQSPLSSPDDQLSDAGHLRREQMLPRLQGAMQQWHRRRRRQRRVALVAVPTLVITMSAIWWRMSSVSTPPNTNPVAIDIDAPAPATHPDTNVPRQLIVFDSITTDPRILDRFSIDNHVSIETIDDESLLALLAEMDRPTGLIATGGEIRLTRNVTDDPQFDAPPGS